MKRNKSMNLPKNYSSSSNHSPSRVDYSKIARLNFPQVGDSGYYGGVGRKHYQNPTHYIHKLILNPDFGNSAENESQKNQSSLVRNKSMGYIDRKQYFNNEEEVANLRTKNNYLKNDLDSLSQLQKQFEKKKSIDKQDPQKQPSTEPILRKNQNTTPLYNRYLLHNSINSHDKLFGPSRQRNIFEKQRKLNPTYISSDLGYN